MNIKINIEVKLAFVLFTILSISACAQKKTETMKGTTAFYQPLAAGITQTKVTFKSEGTTIVGVIYTPKTGVSKNGKFATVVVNGPASGVKEQVSAIYARHLAEQGFIALIFDHRKWGESEGEPRQEHDPQDRVTDIKNAINYLYTRKDVDTARIGSLGICVGAGYALTASVTDPRIKATALVAGVYGWARTNKATFGEEWLQKYLIQINNALALEQETGKVQYLQAVGPAGTTVPLASPSPEAYDYYGNPERSYSPHWENRYTWSSIAKLMSFEAFPFATLMSTPLIVIHGTKDPFGTADMAKEIYNGASGPKDFVLIPNEKHTDFYEGKPTAPASDSVAAWMKKYL